MAKIGGLGGISGPGGFGKPERTPSPQERASAEEVKRTINGPADNVQRPMSRFEMVQLQSPAKSYGPIKGEVKDENPDTKRLQKGIGKAAGRSLKAVSAFASAVKGG